MMDDNDDDDGKAKTQTKACSVIASMKNTSFSQKKMLQHKTLAMCLKGFVPFCS